MCAKWQKQIFFSIHTNLIPSGTCCIKILIIFLAHDSFGSLSITEIKQHSLSLLLKISKQCSVFYPLYLQLTWNPRSITIMWGKRGSPIHPVTSRRVPAHHLTLEERHSQRTLVILLPRAVGSEPLMTLLGQHMRTYQWHFKKLHWLRSTSTVVHERMDVHLQPLNHEVLVSMWSNKMNSCLMPCAGK